MFLFAADVLYPAAGGGSAPSAPTNLNATAGNNSVALTWDASSGATSYTVKRGTASGVWGTTLSSSVTLTNYTDSTAVNGTHYYYTVYAVNASGTSAAATEDDATPAAPGGLVSITDQTVAQSGTIAGQTAGYRLNTSGAAQARNRNSYSTLETWKLLGASSDYVAYVTVSGDPLTSGTTDAEVNLNTSPEWYITAPNGGMLTSVLTVQIRDGSTHSVLDTATITLVSEDD